jgi:hypothetical protein
MNGWLTFWTWALLIGLSFFAVVVITVTIGGLRDIRDMLRSLKAGGNDPGFDPIVAARDEDTPGSG